MKFFEILLFYFVMEAEGEFWAKSLANQGIFLISADQVYLSESSITVEFVYKNLASLSSYLITAEKLPSGQTQIKMSPESPYFVMENGKVKFPGEEGQHLLVEKYDIENIWCQEGFLSKVAVPEEVLKSKLEELSSERLNSGYILSIPIQDLEKYYLTQGIVSACSKVNEFLTVITVNIPFVMSTTNYEFKRVVALDFVDPVSHFVCNGRVNDVEHILVRNDKVIPLPIPQTNFDRKELVGFEKCAIGSEVHNYLFNGSQWYKLCQLDSKTLSRIERDYDIPKSACLDIINEGKNLKQTEEHCLLNNCTAKVNTGNKVFMFQYLPNSYMLTNVKKIVKVRCSNKSRDITMEHPPRSGVVTVTLSCGCKVFHGDAQLLETDRCKWYSKTIREIDFSGEEVEVVNVLPSQYVTKYYTRPAILKYLDYVNQLTKIEQYVPDWVVQYVLHFYNWIADFFLLLFGFRFVYFILIMSFENNSFKAFPMVINGIEDVDRYGFLLIQVRILQYIFNLDN